MTNEDDGHSESNYGGEHGSEEWLKERYREANGDMLVGEMADEAGVSNESIRYHLDKHDIIERGVECEVCGNNFKQITNTHLRKHNMTVDEYREEYPKANLGKNDGWDEGMWHQNDMENPMSGTGGKNHPNSVEYEEHDCDNCGATLERPPSQFRGRHVFCDRECYMEWYTVEGDSQDYHKKMLEEAKGDYQSNREKALNRDGYTCRVCGATENLHVHHVVPLRSGGSNYVYNLSTVCGSCHNSIVEPHGAKDYVEGTRKVEIDTGHRLYHHDWKCQNPHGHRYKIELTIGGLINSEKMVADFGDLKDLMWGVLDNDIDHGMLLNKKDEEFIELCEKKGWRHRVMDGDPTVENIADWLWDQFEEYADRDMEMYRTRWRIIEIKVWETPNCSVSIRRE